MHIKHLTHFGYILSYQYILQFFPTIKINFYVSFMYAHISLPEITAYQKIWKCHTFKHFINHHLYFSFYYSIVCVTLYFLLILYLKSIQKFYNNYFIWTNLFLVFSLFWKFYIFLSLFQINHVKWS